MENARKNKFWEDEDGNQSSTRVISFLFAIFFFVFTIRYLENPENTIDVNFLSLEAELLIAIFAPKYIKDFLFLKFKKKDDV